MYNREKAVAYAQKWAYSRNPTFADFEEMGVIVPTLFPNVSMRGAV